MTDSLAARLTGFRETVKVWLAAASAAESLYLLANSEGPGEPDRHGTRRALAAASAAERDTARAVADEGERLAAELARAGIDPAPVVEAQTAARRDCAGWRFAPGPRFFERWPAAESTIAAAAVRIRATAAGKSKPGRPDKEDMNLRARDALKGRPPRGYKRWTTRTLGDVIGCSGSYIPQLPAWRAYFAKHGPQRKGAPKAVAFTPELAATVGKPDAELKALIAEQAGDDEGSPLDSAPRPKRPRRPKV